MDQHAANTDDLCGIEQTSCKNLRLGNLRGSRQNRSRKQVELGAILFRSDCATMDRTIRIGAGADNDRALSGLLRSQRTVKELRTIANRSEEVLWTLTSQF
jgi:hypothetical protein